MKRAILIPSLLLLFAQISVAQPALDFKRAVVNWPTIELYLTVECNGNLAYDMTEQDFRIVENGAVIPDFTLSCPDIQNPRAMSVSLVFDVSGSMGGTGNAGAKVAGHAFVDLMNGVTDEATIVAFNSQVTILQRMTTIKSMLHSAVDMLGASGATAVWDGIYTGIEELINNGVNQCRAVIAMTDGGDNSSTRTPSEIISLANRNGIHVYTIGLGSAVNMVQLQQIALMTGGKYYQTPNAGQLAAIFQEIHTEISQCVLECVIKYQRVCADGKQRTVNLQLNDFCGGRDAQQQIYQAPLDSATYSDLHMELEDAAGPGHQELVVPLNLMTPMSGEIFYPLFVSLRFDQSCMQFQTVRTPVGSLLRGIPISVTPVTGGVSISTASPRNLTGSGKLMEFVFRATNPLDTATCVLDVANAMFDEGCLLPKIDGAEAFFFPGSDVGAYLYLLRVEPLIGKTKLHFTFWCDGNRLTQIDPQNLRLTSNGQTVSSFQLSCPPGGNDCVIEFEEPCPDGSSKTLTLQTIDLCDTSLVASISYAHVDARKQIALSGPAHLCPGKSLTLDAGPGLASYLWSSGQSTRTIQTSSAGVYTVTVGPDQSGCIPLFDTVAVTVAVPPRIDPPGPIGTCKGKPVLLDLGTGYASYLWSTGETTRWIRVEDSGQYSVTVTDAGGCTMTAPPVIVQVSDDIHPVIAADGPLNICEGEQVVLDAGADYDRYKWSTGETLRWIMVTSTGNYSVVVFDQDGCRGESDTVSVRVSPVPTPTIVYDGPLAFCAGEQRKLDVRPEYAKYLWSTGATTQTIVVTASGTYTVTVTNGEGCEGTSREIEVTVYPSPEVPVISRSGDVLTTAAAFQFQWYRDGAAIPAATNQFYVAAQTGRYQVEVTNEFGCKAISEMFDITVLGTGASPVSVRSFEIYPDPNDGTFMVEIESTRHTSVHLSVTDILGRVVYDHSENGVSGVWRRQIVLDGNASGVYFVHLTTRGGYLLKKVVKR